MAAKAQAQEALPEFVEANFFELKRGKERFTFTATDIAGRPQLTYDDGSQSRTYTGSEIEQEKTAVGLLLTVKKVIPDGPTEKITLVLPTVLLADNPEKVTTFVVYTHVDGNITGRPLNPGPVETYKVKTFRGKAQFVLS
jgi:hypothetical protein